MRWLKAPGLSPLGFVVRAAALALVYGLLTAAGLREHLSILSLTVPDGGTQGRSLFWAALYLVAHFAFVLGVPILLIAAALQATVERLLRGPPPSR